MHRRIFPFLLAQLLVLSFQSSGQSLSGTVVDENDQGLPFVSIYVKGSSHGTTSNFNGQFNFKLDAGQYTIVFQYVGYKTLEKEVSVGQQNEELRVKMSPDVLELQEVIVTAGGEDPAYQIIRNAISKRKFHLKEVESFSSMAYVKGMQRLDKAPEKVLGFAVTVDTGIVYLSESISELNFKQPDEYKEKVISSKVSGDPQAFTWNEASQMNVTFYENLLSLEGVTERGYVSPIAENALLFYDYELLGTVFENEVLVNKVRVIPKRPNDPVFEGLIYIVEDSWRIHSTDLLLTKQHQLEFIDSLQIRQMYAPVSDDIWMVFSQRFDFQFKIFGFVGSGRFAVVYSDYEIEPGFDKKYFRGAKVKVERESNQRDSIYWSQIRPIPLTQEEVIDYEVKDSIRFVKESKEYKDSIDRKSNKFTVSNLFLGGYRYQNSFERTSYYFDPIIRILNYNVVEGLVVNARVVYRKDFEDQRYYTFTPEFRYGFSNKRFNSRLTAYYSYNRKKYAFSQFQFGRFVSQYNSENPISEIINTFESLIDERNFMRLYEKWYAKYRHRIEVVNGIVVTGSLEWAQRSELQNTTDFSFIDRSSREFEPNVPGNVEIDDASFSTNQALILDAEVRFRIRQKYIDRPDRKYNLDSKYPTFFLSYRKGIPSVLSSDVNFDLITARVKDNLDYGLVGKGAYLIKGGAFLNDDELTFVDFYHFNGNRTQFGDFELGNFQLLPYYEFSTNDGFISGHYQHNFNGFLFNKIPLARKLKLQTVGTVNYLYTDALGHYLEFGYGIEHIFKFLRVDYFTALVNGSEVSNGFRIGFGF
ncbi:MAG: DUF5686 and carboxypeptidase regulatory-like domain-containing protein [Bacteroidota bacterium]